MHGEFFAILCQPTKGASVQALEFIRYVDASFYKKKSRWDYQYRSQSSYFFKKIIQTGSMVVPFPERPAEWSQSGHEKEERGHGLSPQPLEFAGRRYWI